MIVVFGSLPDALSIEYMADVLTVVISKNGWHWWTS